MAKASPFDLRFLESAENVRGVLTEVLGRTPTARVARGISVCLQQGRMFFESALEAPLEIRPLPLYYGMMAYAKAIVAARGLKSLEHLNRSHGLKDISSQAATLAELKIRIGSRGTFQEFNDVIRDFEGISYFEHAMSRRHPLPTVASSELRQRDMSLKDILARIPGLQDLFLATFREESKVLPFMLYSHGAPTDQVDLRIDTPQLYEDRASLQRIVVAIREKHPILTRWRFMRAEKAWDNSILVFENIENRENEFTPDNLIDASDGRLTGIAANRPPTYVDFRQLLEPLAGGISREWPCFVEPIGGAHVSDVSLLYLGVCLLSSLVRYRPQIWVHSVSRFVTDERPADDQALALIDHFMGAARSAFLDLVPRALTKP